MTTEFNIDAIVSNLTLLTVIMIMLSTGLKLSFVQVTSLFRQPRLLGRSLISAVLIVPLVTLSLVVLLWDFLPSDFGIGILLLAAAPGAPLALKLTEKARGDTTYAVSLMVILAILAVITFPIIVVLTLAEDVQINPLQVISVIAITQLIPLSAGLAAHRFWPTLAGDLEGPATKISNILFPLLIVLVIVTDFDTILSLGLLSIGVMFAVLGASLVVGHLIGGPALSTRTALGVTTTVRNAALALLIASLNFPGTEVISTIAAYGVLTFAVVIPYSSYCKKRIAKDKVQ
jgi:BASS family bile acid:Na+ symporter